MIPNPIRSPRRVAAIILALATLAACGGNDDDTAEPPATSAAVPNTPPSTVLPPATTIPPTDLAPTTDAPSPESSAAPSTSAPASSTPDIDEAEAAVIAAAENAWYLFNEAKLDPTNDDKVQAALAAYTGEALTRVETILNDYRASGLRSVTFDLAPASIDVFEETVSVDNESGIATVESCTLGSNVLVQVAGNDDGTDRVLDDSITSYHEQNTYVLSSGQWLYTDGIDLGVFEGAIECADVG